MLLTLPGVITVSVCVLSHFSGVWLFATPWIEAHQAPLSMRFSRQEYWRRLLCSPPGDLPNSEDLPDSVIWTPVFYVFCFGRRVLYHWEAPSVSRSINIITTLFPECLPTGKKVLSIPCTFSWKTIQTVREASLNMSQTPFKIHLKPYPRTTDIIYKSPVNAKAHFQEENKHLRICFWIWIRINLWEAVEATIINLYCTENISDQVIIFLGCEILQERISLLKMLKIQEFSLQK